MVNASITFTARKLLLTHINACLRNKDILPTIGFNHDENRRVVSKWIGSQILRLPALELFMCTRVAWNQGFLPSGSSYVDGEAHWVMGLQIAQITAKQHILSIRWWWRHLPSSLTTESSSISFKRPQFVPNSQKTYVKSTKLASTIFTF